MPGSGSAGTETAGDGADAPGSEAMEPQPVTAKRGGVNPALAIWPVALIYPPWSIPCPPSMRTTARKVTAGREGGTRRHERRGGGQANSWTGPRKHSGEPGSQWSARSGNARQWRDGIRQWGRGSDDGRRAGRHPRSTARGKHPGFRRHHLRRRTAPAGGSAEIERPDCANGRRSRRELRAKNPDFGGGMAAAAAALSVAASVDAVAHRLSMAPNTPRQPIFPAAMTTMSWHDNCVRQRCESRILRCEKSYGPNTASTKALRSPTRDPLAVSHVFGDGAAHRLRIGNG